MVNSEDKQERRDVRSEGTRIGDSRDSLGSLVGRSMFGGGLMGIANLVPGISGGTMLLAAGIYPRFINAIAEITKFRFQFRSMMVLGCVVASAGLAILLGAGLFKDLVIEYRWVMYSLFIGLTLGGVPLVWKMAQPIRPTFMISAVCAIGAMVGIFWMQQNNIAGSSESNVLMSIVAGLAGASAMILPGLSGGYILLLLGQYVPILSAISQFKDAIEARDMTAAMDPALTVLVPVGVGVIAGVVIVGNLIQWLLHNYRQATLGVLFGLLLGSTVGLWPFQRGVEPTIGQTIKGMPVTSTDISEIDPEDWPTEFFRPKAIQIAGAFGLVLLGLAVTLGVARIGGNENEI